MDSQVFETTRPTKLFFRCAIPAMISMAVGSLYSIADGVFVGRFIGENALAAVNLVMPLVMIIFAISNMIATGASVRISMLLGQQNREEASRTFSFTLKVIAGISLIVGAVGFAFAEPILALLGRGATEEAIDFAVIYLKMYALFMPVMPIFFATDNFLRICGKEKLSMGINVLTQLLNIVLDFVLIVLWGQGVWAAAFTSCVSMALGTVITLLLFKGKRYDLYYTRGKVALSAFFRLMANGASELFSNIAVSVMSLLLNAYLLRYGGTTAMAAFSVVMYVDSIIGMLIFGMCDSLQPAISHCYGAGLIGKVKAIEKRVVLASAVLSVCSLLFMRYAGPLVAPFFIRREDTALLEMSLVAMRLFSVSYLFGWVDMTLSSYFTALEKPVRSLALSFFGALVFPAASLVAMARLWGLNGVWLMSAVSGFLAAVVAVIMLVTIRYPDAGEERRGAAKPVAVP